MPHHHRTALLASLCALASPLAAQTVAPQARTLSVHIGGLR
jgi:hypothetical protein